MVRALVVVRRPVPDAVAKITLLIRAEQTTSVPTVMVTTLHTQGLVHTSKKKMKYWTQGEEENYLSGCEALSLFFREAL